MSTTTSSTTASEQQHTSSSPPRLAAHDWWPDAIPQPATPSPSATPAPPPPLTTLDDACQLHLWNLITAALGDTPPHRVESVFYSVLEALSAISEPGVLSGLQRTACIRWKAEAQLKAAAASQASSSSTAATGPSRWTKLAWPAAALRSMMSAQASSSASGPAQALEASLAEGSVHRLSKEERIRKRDVALAILSNALWLVTNQTHQSNHDAAPSPSREASPDDAASRAKREPHKRGALPTFIAPSAPTTALSAATTPAHEAANPLLLVPPNTAQADAGSSASVDWTVLDAASGTTTPKIDEPRGPSKAMERLTSLNVAAGNALQQRMADEGSRSASSSRDPSPSRQRSDANLAQTVALEKAEREAEREFIARVGKDCEERVKMVLAVFMVETHCDGQQGGSWSGNSGQGMSTAKSERTIRADNTCKAARRPNGFVDWVSDEFRGKPLYAHGGYVSHASEERCKKQGGTFVVCAADEQEAKLLCDTIAVALYAAASMLLESALLVNGGHQRPQPTGPLPFALAPFSQDEDEDGPDDAGDEVAPTTETTPEGISSSPSTAGRSSSKRWGKGLWGMLQSGSDAVSAALGGSRTADASYDDSPRTPTRPALHRTRTENTIVSHTIGDDIAPPARLRSRLGRFLNHLASGRSHRDEEDEADDVEDGGPSGLGSPTLRSTERESIRSDERRTVKKVAKPAPPMIPLSATPELASVMTKWCPPADSLRGFDFLRRFIELQSLAVALPAVSSSNASEAYFGPANAKSCEAINFYLAEMPGRDIHLGHVIEDLCSRARFEQQRRPRSREDGKTSQPSPSPLQMSFLHGSHEIVFTVKACSTTKDALPAVEHSSEDIEAVATTMHANRDAARTAVALADGAIQAAEATEQPANDSSIVMWSRNIKTGVDSPAVALSEQAWMMSFAKYLETAIYHPAFAPQENTLRFFAREGVLVKLVVKPLRVYDLLIEGPIVCASSAPQNQVAPAERPKASVAQDSQRFYASLKRNITRMEDVIAARAGQDTPAPSSLDLLHHLGTALRADELELTDLIESTEASYINDARKALRESCLSSRSRLHAWRDKHLTSEEKTEVGESTYEEPDYVTLRTHYALPGSRFVVREDEPLSLVAFSISSRDVNTELLRQQQSDSSPSTALDILDWRNNVGDREQAPSQRHLSSSQLSVSSSSSSASSSAASRDPDDDAWQIEPERMVSTVKRKRRSGKEASFLALTLRRVSSSLSASSQSSDVGGAGEGDDGPAATSTISSTLSGRETFKAEVNRVPAQQRSRQTALASLFPADAGAGTADSGASTMRSTSQQYLSPTSPPPPSSWSSAFSSLGSKSGARNLSENARLAAGAESPHIKHSLTHGSTKLSCTTWFAADFATLRSLWGIDEARYAESLSRSAPWQALGGKTRSSFYKTADEHWVAKELLSKGHALVAAVDELAALLELAPAYLKFMQHAVAEHCPTLLVKIAGFYTVKIKDRATGEVRLRRSFMVIENLFADCAAGVQRFDLKGIRERKATARSAASATGAQTATTTGSVATVMSEKEPAGQDSTTREAVYWDADWIEQYASNAYVPAASRELFHQALRNDLAFLTAANVMDFSLLVGVTGGGGEGSQGRPSIRVRIVDFLSAFTVAKALESSGKKAWKGEQRATVLPPDQYAARFQAAMRGYFVSVPEGWEQRLRAERRSDGRESEEGTDAAGTMRAKPGQAAGRQRVQLSSVF